MQAARLAEAALRQRLNLRQLHSRHKVGIKLAATHVQIPLGSPL
jgi:hypothetical protein